MEFKSAKETQSDREVFDRIAPGWYNRRHRTIFRYELDELAKRWAKGRLLNIGSGHGADFLSFIGNDRFELHGLDISKEMLRFAQKYSLKFKFCPRLVQADAVLLPYKNETFDMAIAVAAYHHIRGIEQPREAFAELFRVLKPGGEAFITVWNRWQPKFWLRRKDTYVKWRTRDEELNRYYHLFSRQEIERMVKRAGFTLLRSSAESAFHFPMKLFARNICLLIKKEGEIALTKS
jgi:tRNA (uracil-5-)-methyltransferase TRM9